MKKWLASAAFALAAAPAVFAVAERTQTVTGVVQSYSAAQHAFTVKMDSGEVRFIWTRDTKFNGVVATGAKVTVRFTAQADGPNLAQTVGILK